MTTRRIVHPKRRGQTVTEYLIVTTALLIAMATLAQTVGCRSLQIMNTAVGRIP